MKISEVLRFWKKSFPRRMKTNLNGKVIMPLLKAQRVSAEALCLQRNSTSL